MGIHVQTEVDDETHEVLKMLAILRGKSLKEIAREALEEYAKKHKKEVEKLIQKDPIWDTIGVLELEEDASEREDWGTVEWQSE
ncbi:ribbon-helix-helix protein, CopG family [Thermococcus sp. 101 C5]|nr:ribbon-helix-helix protein, CopG family [Thermococcus sp. 101 C5]